MALQYSKIDRIPKRLTHLLSGAHQKRRPINCVHSQDVLSDKVQRRPIPIELLMLIASPPARGDIIRQRIKPNIHRVICISGNAYTPLDRDAADGQILEPACHKRDNLISADIRLHKLWMRRVVIQQRLLECRKPKEVTLLSKPLERPFVNRTHRVGGLLIDVFELVAIRAVPPFVMRLVDVSSLVEYPPKLGDRGLVTRISCSNPLIVFDIERCKRSLELVDNLIDVLLDFNAARGRCAFDIDSVFVSARQKVTIDAALPIEACESVGYQGRIRVPNVRLGVDVENRSGYVEGVFSHFRRSACCTEVIDLRSRPQVWPVIETDNLFTVHHECIEALLRKVIQTYGESVPFELSLEGIAWINAPIPDHLFFKVTLHISRHTSPRHSQSKPSIQF